MTDVITYDSLTDEVLLDLLVTVEDRLPRAAVDEFLARAPRIIAPLTALVSARESWQQELPAWWAPIHATYLLGAIGDPSVIPALILAIEHAEAQDCDWVTGEIPSILGRFGAPARPPLITLLNDRSRSPYLRATAAEALAATTLADPVDADSIFGLIGACLADPAEDEDLRDIAGNLLLDFRRLEHKDTLLAFAREQERKHRHDPMFPLAFSEQDVVGAFAKPTPTLRHYTRNWLDFYSPSAIAQRQARWQEEDRRQEEPDDSEKNPLDDDLLDLLPVEPIVRSEAKIGRNDPCPCGSGKKYKKCCLDRAAIQLVLTPALFSEADRASILNKLRVFADRPDQVADVAEASFDYWGDRLYDRDEDEQRRVLELPQAEVMRTAWLWFDAELPDKRTVADRFLAAEGGALTPGERAFLDQARATYQGLYEVEAVNLDEGFTLRDLSTEERIRVRERTATHGVARWDLIVARLMPRPDGSRVLEAGLLQLSPRDAEMLLPQWQNAERTFQARFPRGSRLAVFKKLGHLLSRWWLTLVAFRPLPTIVTPEGDLLIFTKAVFDVLDQEQLFGLLAHTEGVEQVTSGVFDWYEITPAFRRTLGTIRVTDERLTLETTSEARAERGRQMLEGLAPQALRYRVTSTEDMKQTMARAESRHRADAPNSLPPDVEAELLGKFYEEHYRGWVDQPVPALDNLTPRQAAGDRRRRPKLITLLKEFENRAAHDAREGRPSYNFTWMWKELGLERP
jgi:hypothetical protein